MLWLTAFAITQLVEVPIYVWALSDRRPWQRPVLAFLASTITHPVVWASTYALAEQVGFWTAVACMEAFAVAVEAGYLRLLRVDRAFAWSLGANAASFGTGLLLQALGLWA